MKISYHEDTDSAYIIFSEGIAAETTEIANDVNVDFTADGQIIGIEIVSNARARLDIDNIIIKRHK